MKSPFQQYKSDVVNEIATAMKLSKKYAKIIAAATVKEHYNQKLFVTEAAEEIMREANIKEYDTFTYKGKEYKARILNSGLRIATSELGDLVINEDGDWSDDAAEYIDRQIVFYVEPKEIDLPDAILEYIAEKHT